MYELASIAYTVSMYLTQTHSLGKDNEIFFVFHSIYWIHFSNAMKFALELVTRYPQLTMSKFDLAIWLRLAPWSTRIIIIINCWYSLHFEAKLTTISNMIEMLSIAAAWQPARWLSLFQTDSRWHHISPDPEVTSSRRYLKKPHCFFLRLWSSIRTRSNESEQVHSQ